MIIIELRPAYPGGATDGCFSVFRADDYLGDIERLSDGAWVGDVTVGNGPPSKPYATRDEAVEYVVTCGQSPR